MRLPWLWVTLTYRWQGKVATALQGESPKSYTYWLTLRSFEAVESLVEHLLWNAYKKQSCGYAKAVFAHQLVLTAKLLTALPVQVTIRWGPITLTASKWQALLETGLLWRHMDPKSASKLLTWPVSPSRKDLCLQGTKECWFPSQHIHCVTGCKMMRELMQEKTMWV